MKILHFADLHLGVETYGRIDAATGLSTRLADFLKVFDELVDYALEARVDLVLFCGDAYKSREPGQTQQREFARRVNRLAANGIPVFLLVGNHDLHNAFNKATAVDIFDTLAVPNVYVSNRPAVYKIPTAGGIVQIASLPWLRRGALLAKEELKNLSFEEVNRKAQEILTGIVGSHADTIDPELPSILAAHIWVAGAAVGSEKQMTIGQEPVLLSGNIANPAFDYVALGHIHRRQVLNPSRVNAPPVVYSGSLERVDFSEESDEKGFYIIEITTDGPKQRQTSFEFHPVSGRRFISITADINFADLAPTATVLRNIEEKRSEIIDAIVRVHIKLPGNLEGLLSMADIRSSLKEASNASITVEITRENRLRTVRWVAGEVTPLEALKAYLDGKKIPQEQANVLIHFGRQLIGD